MCFLNFDWLGFAATPQEAVRIIKDTGIFYLAISIAYILSYFYMSWHSLTFPKIKKVHYFGIIMWAFVGICLILHPHILSFVFSLFVTLLALFVLYQLTFTSALTASVNLDSPKINSDDKKIMYAQILINKMGYKLQDIFEISLINEQILWLLILYRAAITLRASFEL